jgi:hypothetical protein
MLTAMSPVDLVPRPTAASVDELLAGVTERHPLSVADGKSGATFERVRIDGQWFVVKHLHVDDDWIMRAFGDVRCRPLLVWRSGLLDALPPGIDHTMVGAAEGLGRNGWGTAILMRDVSAHLVPEGDDAVALEQHLGFMDHMAALHARFWGWVDTIGLCPYSNRWTTFSDEMVAVERDRGFRDPVPPIIERGWATFPSRVPADVCDAVLALRRDLDPLMAALQATPSTFLHGDWKMGNLGTNPDGSTVLLDWAGPGEGPGCAELMWYLAINAARLPHSKGAAVDAYRDALERHGIATTDWFEAQIALASLGALVQFGWEKVLGSDAELAWWVDRARQGLTHL